MPKPTKQSKQDHSQGITEDCANSSEASARSDHTRIHESSLPELCLNITEVIAEEGRCTQKMLNDSFVKLESGLDVKVDSIIKRIDDVTAVTLATRQAEAETRISSLEDDIFQISAQLSPKMVTFLMNPHRLMLLFAVFMLSYIALRYHQDPCYNFLNKTLLHKLSEEDSFK